MTDNFELDEIEKSIDEYSDAIIKLSGGNNRAVTLLLDALEQSARHAGAINYKIKSALDAAAQIDN